MISFSLKIGGNCARVAASLRCAAKHVIRAGVQPYTSKRGCVQLHGAHTDDGTSSGSNCPSSSWQGNTTRQVSSASRERLCNTSHGLCSAHFLQVREVFDHVLAHILRPIDEHVGLQVLCGRHLTQPHCSLGCR